MLKQLGRTCVAALCVSVFASAPAHAAGDRERIQQIVDDLKTRLAIPQTINVTVVRTNPKLFSVAPVEHENGTFLLSVEEDFAQALNEDELTAAVAHELGHVWIYTHFPYLQTEQLANEIAMRVVSRESLVPVYDRMFERVRVS